MKQLDPKAVWFFFLSYLPRFIILFIILSMFLGPMILSLGIMSTVFFVQKSGINTPIEVNAPSGIIFLPFVVGFFLCVLVILLVSYLWARLSYKYYKYELTDLGFRKESGVIYKKYVTIPYDRIQNVDIYRGIIARTLGLSDLQIQTAGNSAVITRYGMAGVGAEGRLPALSQEVAEQLRDELIKRAHQPKNQGL